MVTFVGAAFFGVDFWRVSSTVPRYVGRSKKAACANVTEYFGLKLYGALLVMGTLGPRRGDIGCESSYTVAFVHRDLF